MARVTLVETGSKQEGANSLFCIPSSQSPVVPPTGRSGKREMPLAESQPLHLRVEHRRLHLK